MTSIYSNSSSSVSAGSVIPLTTVAVQKGTCTQASTNGVQINSAGLYDISATVTALITAGGIANFQVYINGTAIPQLTSGGSYSTTGEPVTITLTGEYPIKGNCCQITNLPAIVTIVNNTGSTEIVSFAKLEVSKRN